MTLEAKLHEERRLRILIEREFNELKEKYDILVTKHSDRHDPDADMIRTQMLRSYRL
jgi:hypothetical protein